MKKIILGLIAGTMLSTTAFAIDKIDASNLALPAEGQVCSDLHDRNSGGINVKALSPYNQCVMIENDMDTGFTYKTFWTKVDNMFIPHNVDDLADMSPSERKEAMKETIIKEVVVERIVEVIVEDMEKINELQREIDTLKKVNIPALNGKISELERDARLAHSVLDVELKQELDIEIPSISNLKYDDDDFGYALRSAITNKINEVIDSKLENALFSHNAKKAAALESKRTPNPGTQAGLNSFSFTAEKNGATALISKDGEFFGSVLTKNVDIMDIISNVADHAYTEGFNDGYDQGFDDGYDQGYADGYTKGFSDGVSSISK